MYVRFATARVRTVFRVSRAPSTIFSRQTSSSSSFFGTSSRSQGSNPSSLPPVNATHIGIADWIMAISIPTPRRRRSNGHFLFNDGNQILLRKKQPNGNIHIQILGGRENKKKLITGESDGSRTRVFPCQMVSCVTCIILI